MAGTPRKPVAATGGPFLVWGMDLYDPGTRERWFRHLAGLVEGRKVIVGLAPLATMTDAVSLLARAGAQKPLLLYTDRGAGPTPGEDEAQLVQVEVPAYTTISEAVGDHDRVLRTLPEQVVAALDGYDPDGEAVHHTGPFVTREPIRGRQVVGGREPAWAALEDKMLADDIWDAVGFPRCERRLVEIDRVDALEASSREIDRGLGVVWAADARDGLNGGGELTRWVVTAEEREAALELLAPRCDRVRVMPFLEGVPCSIHGIVLPDGTAVLRPMELAILRGPGRRFVFGGQGTTWDPPPPDREEMRDLVRRTGELLRHRVGYRGGFGIDGVLTAEGFRPTELNPRYSGGLAILGHLVEGNLLSLLQLNLATGRDPGVGAADLEAWALAVLDERRCAVAKASSFRRRIEEPVRIPVAWDGRELSRDDSAELEVLAGQWGAGVFAKVDADRVLRVGDRVGPLNAALVRLLDSELDLGFGPVEAAPSVRDGDSVAAEPEPRTGTDVAPGAAGPQQDSRTGVEVAARVDVAPDVRRRADVVPGSGDEQGEHDDGGVRHDLADADLLGGQPPAR